MGKVLILDEKEKKDLLSQIDSRDTYNDVMALLDTIKQRNNCPYTLDKYRQIAKNSITEYKSRLGTSIKEMRNIF